MIHLHRLEYLFERKVERDYYSLARENKLGSNRVHSHHVKLINHNMPDVGRS